MPLLRSGGRKSLATSGFPGAYPAQKGIYTLSPETALLLRNKSTAKGVIYYGSFPGGTKQGLQSQLKAIYKDNADTIVGNCDTTLFLGGKEKTTLKEISEILGKETIDSFNTSETRGRELSHTGNVSPVEKPPSA